MNSEAEIAYYDWAAHQIYGFTLDGLTTTMIREAFLAGYELGRESGFVDGQISMSDKLGNDHEQSN